MELTPGAILGGRYRADRRVGAGGVGQVWAGQRVDDGVPVAIKTLLPAAAGHHELSTRFRREAKFLAGVHSNYVARVLDFLSDDRYGLVLVMELVEGEPLNEILARRPLSIEEALDVAWDTLGGIADLHRAQIIHRDLKPGNLILRQLPNGRTRTVIVDFGMSRFTGVDNHGEEVTALTRVDIAVGTMQYMAPEQILNSRGVTGAADIYAVGAFLYRAIAGRHAFGDLDDGTLARQKLVLDPPPLSSGRGDALALRFEAIVMRMIQRKPEDRYARAEDVLSDLAPLRSGSFVEEPLWRPEAMLVSAPSGASAPIPEAIPEPIATPPPPRRRGLALLLGLFVCAGSAVAGVAIYRPAWLGRVASLSAATEAPPPASVAAPPRESAPPAVLRPLASAPPIPVASTAQPKLVARAAPAPVPRAQPKPAPPSAPAEAPKPIATASEAPPASSQSAPQPLEE